ncbi:MAG: hypothetical protein IKX45_07505 [Bacteroidales bacterium]|nr:hypothetical protein [Bacteroidales bacterium]
MRKIFVLLFVAFASLIAAAQALPSKVEVKIKSKDHVQGMAIDTAAHCFYLSFTTSMVKVDYEGNVLASIDSINGHLGAMTFDAATRKLYASLECKDDVIGQGIAKNLGKDAYSQSKFYIVVFDVDGGLTEQPGAGSPVVEGQWEVTEAINDYKTRYGCSGIDGVTIAPRMGKKRGKPRLYVAYGIYGDISRRDNDHQILLEFKPNRFRHDHLPKASAKYFVFTGNTEWGVQNLCYDPNTRCIFMACYAGKKPEYPNFSLFAVPVTQKPVKKVLRGLEEDGEHLSLELWHQGLLASVPGLRGWRFGDPTTGVCTLGDGTWFVSTPLKLKKGFQTATIRQLKWKGGPVENPFE